MKPCTRCGKCCEAEICQAGKMAIEMEGLVPISPKFSTVCPYLAKRKDGLSACILIMAEQLSPMPKLIAEALGIGKGCTNPEEA